MRIKVRKRGKIEPSVYLYVILKSILKTSIRIKKEYLYNNIFPEFYLNTIASIGRPSYIDG